MPPPPFSPAPASFFWANVATVRGRAARLCLCSLALLAAGACRRNRQSSAQVPNLAVAYDMRPIDAASVGRGRDGEGDGDNAALQRALFMPAGEVAARLHTFVASGDLQLSLVQNNNVVWQEKAQTQLAWDANGNVRSAYRGSRHSFEVVAVGEKAYVRLDKGHIRGKGRRDVEVAELVEIGYSGLRQGLQQFGGVSAHTPRPEQVAGRPAITYALERADDASPAAELAAKKRAGAVLFPPGALPQVTPGAWRTSVREARLSGTVSLDEATGVVLQARVTGQLSFAAADGGHAQLRLQLRHSIAEVGRQTPVREPAGSVSEYRRPIRPREPLAFFRDQLPPGSLAPTPPPR